MNNKWSTSKNLIVPMSVEFSKDYRVMLDNAKTLEDLKCELHKRRMLIWDAYDIVKNWNEKDFRRFLKCKTMERKGHFMGEANFKRFGVVILPGMLIKISVIADHFKVFEGLLFNRMIEVGRLENIGGRIKDVG